MLLSCSSVGACAFRLRILALRRVVAMDTGMKRSPSLPASIREPPGMACITPCGSECVNDFASPGDINLVCDCRVV